MVESGGAVVKNPSAMQEGQETWVQSLGQEDSLEEEMTKYSSVLAWKITLTEEPGRLQSMGSVLDITERAWASNYVSS